MLGPDTGTLGHGVATTSHQPGYSQELKAEQVIFSRLSAAQQIQPQLGMGLLIFNTSLLSQSSSDSLLIQPYSLVCVSIHVPEKVWPSLVASR